jgi:hypothetical protein
VEDQILSNRKITVEEVENEDGISRTTKKKKKKKKKKPTLPEPVKEALPPLTPSTPQGPAPTSPPKQQATGPKSPVRSPSLNTAPPTAVPRTSTASLALPTAQTSAQSARSYLQSEKFGDQKTKIKSRPDHASLFSNPEKKGFFSKFAGKDKTPATEIGDKGTKHNWFTRLKKKTKGHMEQLLGTADNEMKGIKPMKWEHFLRVCITPHIHTGTTLTYRQSGHAGDGL